LRGVEFDRIGTGNREIGVVAQEIEKVLPEVVERGVNGWKTVSYGNIVAVLIEAVKDLKERLDSK
jgi:hypothetical protein